MKFKMPRQIITQDIARILSREVRKQKWLIPRLPKKNLKEIAEISKKIILQGIPENLVCKKLSCNLGHGIFLHPKANPILKGQVIAPYSGEVSIVLKDDPEDGGSYAFTPVEDMCLTKEEQLCLMKHPRYSSKRRYSFKVDAQRKGNFTRFINHSEKPNIKARIVSVAPNLVEVVYIAKKTIHPGEQLLVCYEEGEKCYWIDSKVEPFRMTPRTFQLNSRLKVCKI